MWGECDFQGGVYSAIPDLNSQHLKLCKTLNYNIGSKSEEIFTSQ